MIRRLLVNQKHGEKIAIIEGDRELRYADLLNRAWGVQSRLAQRQPQNIAILLPNGSDYLAALWGTVMAGMTAFPLNALMTGHEILPLLRQAAVGTVITVTEYKSLFEGMGEFEAPLPEVLCMDEWEGGAPECAARDIAPDKPMLLLSTSGTTGKSKIVQLSERNVEAAVLGYLDKLRLHEIDESHIRYTLAAPFASVYGIMILSACLMRSFPIVVLDSAFTLDALYRAAEKHRITHYEGSTSAILLMEQMAGRAIPYDVHTLKYFGFGGSKVSGSTIEKLLRAYPGMEFYQGYGMTEASPLIAKHPRGKLEKTESVGTAIKGMEIAVETDNAIARTPYTKGEILVRGPNVMLGYLDNEGETSRALKNGYLHTGDIGYLDGKGYLYICGRKKNVIIVRGFTVYPEEIEACIQNSRLAGDCYVYGRADADGGERVCAEIVPINPEISEEDIRRHCQTHLAEYKRPQKITLCESIRKGPSGKTERRGLPWS